MYRWFNIQQFCVLPTQRIYVLSVDLRTNRLFPYTALTYWFCNRRRVFTAWHELDLLYNLKKLKRLSTI